MQIYSNVLSSDSNPLPPVELSLSAPRLIIWADSPSKRPTWDLAIRLRQMVNYDAGLGWVETHYQRIFLGKKTLVNLPVVANPYLLRLEVPFWFPDMAIDIWEDWQQSAIPVGLFLPHAGEPESPILYAAQTRFLQVTSDQVRTIGRPGSGADLTEQWLRQLFFHFWDRYPIRSEIYTATGQAIARGHSAAEDWEANRRLLMPDFRGAALVGAGGSVGPGGILVGQNQISLAIDNLPAHAHAGSFMDSAGAHTHSLTVDSAGAHTHSLSINSAGAHEHTGSAASAGAHTHSLSIDSAGAHGHTVQATGGPSNTATGGSAARLIAQDPGTIATSTAGAHGHTGSAASAGAHTHSLSIDSAGAHGHTGSAASAGAHTHTGSTSGANNHTHSLTIAAQGNGVPISVQQLSAAEHWFISCGVF